MGYSESSLRRLVDKIQDGSLSNSREHVLNRATSTSRTISRRLDQSMLDNTLLDEYDNPIIMGEEEDDDPSNSSAPTTVEVEPTYTNPARTTIDQRFDNPNQVPPLPDFDQPQETNHQSVFTLSEICTYQLISFLDEAKAPRNCYDRLIALLRRQQKMGFCISNAIGRDTFLKSLTRKFGTPVINTAIVDETPVFKFPFMHMLQNLLDVVGPDLHLIDSSSIRPIGLNDELWNTRWMINTFQYGHRDFSIEHDVMLPIIIYMDKTGTDAYQRYSLEPVLFSLGNIPREKRESRRSWRHLGFIPSNKRIEKSIPKLQFHHNCLEAILEELKLAQKEHPTVRIKLPSGVVKELRARLPILVVMGDQLSQDTLCARLKANAGGASRIHRSCMCSYLSVDDPAMTCMSVSKHLLDHMTQRALLSDSQISSLTDGSKIETDFFKKVRQMNQRFLAKPYGTYPVRNAFDGADFGGWTEGIYEATLDDFMHSTELGVIKTLNEVVFQGLTKSESIEIEYLIQTFLSGVKSSVRSTYPRWRLSDGFSRQKLMTSTERVGTLFSLCLSLQSHEIQQRVSAAHQRQRQKYVTLTGTTSLSDPTRNNARSDETSSDTDDSRSAATDVSDNESSNKLDDDSFVQETTPDSEETLEKEDKFYFESHFHRNITPQQIQHALEHANRHGFDISQLRSFDLLQTNQFVTQAHVLFRKQKHSYPRRTIEGYFDIDADTVVPGDILQLAINSVEVPPEDIFPERRYYGVESVVLKHFKEKRKIKGTGRTAAILNQDMHAVTLFLEYVLCFHAFCKYSSSLPSCLRDNFENVHDGGRSMVRYVERQFYRGDDTVDYRTTKLHCHRRIGQNYQEMRSLMNFCTEVGERMLKTEAKQISRTAQQRGEVTFELQTAARVLERQVLETFGDIHKELLKPPVKRSRPQIDQFSRRLPHFVFSRQDPTVFAMDRHGRTIPPNDQTGHIPNIIKKTLLQHESSLSTFEIYNEAILRDGSYIRAFPMYRNESPFYDFVQVQWEDSSYPTKVVCFYKGQCLDSDSLNDTGNLWALVHVVDEKSLGKVNGYSNTFLSNHYNLKYERGQPTLYSVPLASIDCAILAFPHEQQTTLFNPNKRGVCVVRPRNEWAYLWIAWNDVLKEENSTVAHNARRRRNDRRFISFNTRPVLQKVKTKLHDYLSIQHDE